MSDEVVFFLIRTCHEDNIFYLVTSLFMHCWSLLGQEFH